VRRVREAGDNRGSFADSVGRWTESLRCAGDFAGAHGFSHALPKRLLDKPHHAIPLRHSA